VSETLAESELFGHRKGAFTGAAAHRTGLFATAFGCGGALYLDDVAEFASNVQPKILQAVEDGIFFPVGSDRVVTIRNGRRLKIYASSQPESLHKLRPDLRDRLSTLVLAIPPLRERVPDILLLADYEVESFAWRCG
jgi:transcriptional regulator with GAF, ATPase, and Fis domain